MTDMSSYDLAGVDEVSAILGLSARTVKRLAKDGVIPVAHKLNGKTGAYVFERAAIIAYGKRINDGRKAELLAFDARLAAVESEAVSA